MKTFFTLLLLTLTGFLHAQQINTIEYFFDNDPGVGSGTKMTLNSATLDSTVNFAVTGLTSGVHILNVRLKNSNNTWGTTYQSPVLIATGTDGYPTITNAEYFFDTDPGFGKGQSMAINQAALDSVLNLPISGLSSGVHLLNIRLRDANNSWSTTYQTGILIVNGAVGNTTIVSAEYYFDTDPGFGKGQSLPINKASLDSVVNFSVTGLTPGSHTIYVRLKNSSDSWGFAGQGSFLLSDGTPGIPQVKSLEYFSDTDSGVNRNPMLPLTPGATIDTTVSVHIADNGGDSSVLGIRLSTQGGQIGNVALTTVSLCNLYKPKSGFRGTRFGDSYNFIDSSLYNTSRKIQWMVGDQVDTAYNNSPVYHYTFPYGFVGTQTVKQVVGSGCRVDTSALEIQQAGVESFSPTTGAIGHDFELDLYGGGLDSTTQVYLQTGSSIFYPYDQTAYQGKLLSAIFDFHKLSPPGAAFGYYFDLHVHFANGRDTVIAGAIAIVDAAECEIESTRVGFRNLTCDRLKGGLDTYVTADLSGPSEMRLGTWNYFTLNATNTSGVLAKETPVWILIPASYDAQFDINWSLPDSDHVSLDSIPADYYQPFDSVINGHRYQYKMYSLIPPFINPGETWSVNFKLRTTVSATDSIIYWVQKPMFGSPLTAIWNCAWDVAGYTPLGCFTGLVDYGKNHAGFPPGYHSDFSHGILNGAFKDAKNLAWNVASTGFSCGAATAAAGKKLAAKTLNILSNAEKKVADRVAGTINNKGLQNCGILDFTKELIAPIYTYFAHDPNYLTGNNEYDSARHYVSNYAPQHYTVTFENEATATAPAQHVYITDTLDANKFIFNTFKFSGYRIGDSSYSLPPARSQIFQTTGIAYYKDVKVLFSGNFDTLSGILRVDFYSMDSSGTHVLSDTSYKGFLPPNTDGFSGTGTVSFSIFARNLGTMETFKNTANIYFDSNTPIATNTWKNTVDTTGPTGSIIKSIPVDDSTTRLVVQHGDVGSGFAYNDIFIKGLSDSVYTLVGSSSQDTITYIGTPGQSYQAFSRAVDNVGNLQARDTSADITFSVSNPLPTHLLSFTGQKVDTRVKLQWSAVNEVNFSHYDVERSGDGVTFTKIGTVAAQGGALTNYYQLYDEHPLPASNYYRLRQVENSGAFSFSRVIRIDFDKSFTVAVTPVPAQNYIIIDGAENFRQVQLVDMSGRIVKQFSTTSGNTFNVQDLSAGMYLVRLVSDSGITTLKMVKE